MKKMAVTIVTLCMIIIPAISFSQSESQPTSPQETDLSSPEVAWNEFTKAIIQGDYDLAKEYCCPGGSSNVNRYKKLGAAKTSGIFKAIKSIEKVYQDEKTAKYKLHRNIKGKNFTTYISFAKIDNQWKINKY